MGMPKPEAVSHDMDAEGLLREVIQVLEDAKADDVVTIELAGKSSVADYMVIRDKAGQWRYPMSPPAEPGQGGADGSAEAGQGLKARDAEGGGLRHGGSRLPRSVPRPRRPWR